MIIEVKRLIFWSGLVNPLNKSSFFSVLIWYRQNDVFLTRISTVKRQRSPERMFKV